MKQRLYEKTKKTFPKKTWWLMLSIRLELYDTCEIEYLCLFSHSYIHIGRSNKKH